MELWRVFQTCRVLLGLVSDDLVQGCVFRACGFFSLVLEFFQLPGLDGELREGLEVFAELLFGFGRCGFHAFQSSTANPTLRVTCQC